MALLTSGEVGGGAPCAEAPISLRFLTYCQRLSGVERRLLVFFTFPTQKHLRMPSAEKTDHS